MTEIDDKIRNSKINFAFVNSYFNSGDYDDPVKFFLDDTFFWDVVPEFKKKTDVYIQKNSVSVQDDLIQYKGYENTEHF